MADEKWGPQTYVTTRLTHTDHIAEDDCNGRSLKNDFLRTESYRVSEFCTWSFAVER
ncbi:hypothetical protein M404DRAFT_997006 [Pisolithus tinctorius Marx 270]|uniref:Uncharacterized protein n=1 Tax=Pisolithus tinctorius Marx 270 TaxID=870435 RepID=A0A0C3PJJ9_PISTI|nr:hypothetical protein M404DRAFT_997006 [Pisolithus tinctorius Marx 270]